MRLCLLLNTKDFVECVFINTMKVKYNLFSAEQNETHRDVE